MTWYRAHYGTYRDGDTVKHIPGTIDRKEMFKTAQRTANETGRTVTIIAETPGACGLNMTIYKVSPTR